MKPQPLLDNLKKLAPSVAQILVVVALITTAVIAYNLGAGTAKHQRGDASTTTAPREAAPVYTCSMHPEIRQGEPGNCPICGMELVLADEVDAEPDAQATHDHSATDDPVGYACAMNCLPPLEEPGECPICGMEMQPVFEDRHDSDEPVSMRQMSMTAEALALLRVQTSTVERREATRSLRLVGQLAVDPRRRAHISADVGGRVDRLHAQYEGDRVEQGQDLVELYSPELLAVQREFLQAIQSAQRLSQNPTESIRNTADSIVAASRERLRLAGLTPEQVEEIAEGGVALERVTLKSPVSGVVINRYVEEGDYVARENRILTVAALDTLWAEIEAFESDLQWLRVGQPVHLTSEAFPGEMFHGDVAWIDPMTTAATRTTRVRVDVDNERGLLKPGMYLQAQIDTVLYDGREVLVIPDSAPLITGRRAIVYVQVPDVERPTFQGHEVVLGPRTRDGYVVEEGLSEGDRVVTHGAFKIDSALQIRARPSMMSPEGGPAMTGHEHHGVETDMPEEEHTHAESPTDQQAETHDEVLITSEIFEKLLPIYLAVSEALAADDFDKAREAWSELAALAPDSGDHGLHAEVDQGSAANDIEDLRAVLEPISNRMIAAVREHGNPATETLHRVHCPMAFDWEGADWIQTGSDVRNPYFGATMYRCGTVEEEFAAR